MNLDPNIGEAQDALQQAHRALVRCDAALVQYHAEQLAREERLNWFRATLDRMLGRSR